MMIATLTDRYQITLPEDVRQALGVDCGDRVEFVTARDGDVRIRPLRRSDVRNLYAITSPGATVRAHTVEEMDDAIGEALAEEDHRIRTGQ